MQFRSPGLDGRTSRCAGYRTSQRIRKRVEEIFGWMKTVGGLRRSRYRGVDAHKRGPISWLELTTCYG